MKKWLLILLVLSMFFLSGFVKMEQGIVVDPGGNGYLYSLELTPSDIGDSGTSLFGLSEDELLKEEEIEIIDGIEYKKKFLKKDFGSLAELDSSGAAVVVERDHDIVTIHVIDDEPGETGLDAETVKMMKAFGFEIDFKITVPGNITNYNGNISEDGNSVTWDFFDLLDHDAIDLFVSFEEVGKTAPAPVPVPTPQVETPVTGDPDAISVVIRGTAIPFGGQPPVFKDGRVLVPLRVVSENLDTQVEWIPSGTVRLSKGEKVVTLTLGSQTVLIKVRDTTSSITLDVPADTINNRTMIPLRAVAEIFDMNVEWDQATRTAIIK